MDAEEQETQAGQDIADAFQALRFLEHQDDAEHQHRHGIGGDLHLQAEAGHQPGAGGGAQVGAEDDADAGRQADQPAPRKEMVITDTSELDCMMVVVTTPKLSAFQGLSVVLRSRFRAAGECLEALFQEQHAKQKNRDAGSDLVEIRTDPEPVSKQETG